MENNTLKRLASQLVDQRKNEGISQKAFAHKLGMKKANLSRIENGKQNISVELLIKIINEYTDGFNLRLDDFKDDDNIYCLKLFDDILIKFSFVEMGGEPYPRISYIDKSKLDLLPFGLKANEDSLLDFLRKRTIPKNRTYVKEILESVGKDTNDIKGIVDISLSLSLNDNYWITKESFKGKYNRYNLYENNFSTALSLLAYTGYGSSNIVFTTSPEFTTEGMLPKAWRRIENKVYLFKGSTSGFANTGNEAYAEFYASQILDIMGINHVSYNLIKWKGIVASVCPLFTSTTTSFVPVSKLIYTSQINEIVEHANSLNSSFKEKIISMLIFDCLIINEDRHFSNFGYLYDSKTKKIIDVAPVFDNGNSLFHYAIQKDLDDLKGYSLTRTNPYNLPFDFIAKRYIGIKQKEQLRKLINFKFKRHEKYNWPEDRLKKIEEFIQMRVKELLEM